MKRILFVAISLLFIQQARGQMLMQGSPMMMPNNPMMACPWDMQPAAGAYEKEDEEDRQKSLKKELKKEVKDRQAQLKKIDDRLEKLREKIDRRLQPELASWVVEHIQQQGSAADYHRDCRSRTGPSAGSTPSNIPVQNADRDPANPEGSGQADVVATPADPYCTGPYAAVWSRNIGNSGTVDTRICRENSQVMVRSSSSYAQGCVDGIAGYMRMYERRRQVEKGLAVAESDLDDFEFGDYDAETEAGCKDGSCYKSKESAPGKNDGIWTKLLTTSISVGIPALLNWQNQKANRKVMERMNQYNVDTCASLGYHPGYAGCSMLNRYPSYLGHQQSPYPSVLPGYMGINNGNYGAVNGAMGSGGFGCMGGGANGMGLSMLGQNMFGMNQGFNPGLNAGINQGFNPGFNGAQGVPPFIGGQGPWGGVQVPQQGQIFNQTGVPPAILPYQAGSGPYQHLTLDNQLNSINGYLGGVPQQFPTGVPRYPSPVMANPYGINGVSGNAFYNNGNTTVFGSGVVTGR